MIAFKSTDNKNYFINQTCIFYEKNTNERIKFLKKNQFFYNEISKILKTIISESNLSFFFCCGNSNIVQKIEADKICIQDISEKIVSDFTSEYQKLSEEENDFTEYNNVVIADIEHQIDPLENLKKLSSNISDDCNVILISKSLIWSGIFKIIKIFQRNKFTSEYNYLSFNYIKNLVDISDFEIVKNEKGIIFPFNIPVITPFLNRVFRFPILNFFCMINFTVLKKKKIKKKENKENKISVIIPCKDEEKNIEIIKNNFFNLGGKTEILFGDDKSTDKTLDEINKIILTDKNIEIKTYEGPGICKSENVYKGIEKANGDIVLIYDADCTVSFEDVEKSLKVLSETNADFVNCTRMIFPQQKNAMKSFNFIGNIFFAQLFSLFFDKKITDTLCGTKIFYKKDWLKLKKSFEVSGMKDLWGDFDLLISAYKNNLKIIEIPVNYYDRVEGKTKMTSVFMNGLRMLYITIKSFYKLRIDY
tara:strand:+ start:395 stop:1822 length:1428 start_codon:yes stop_codon:yes gene_type:complete